MAESIVDDQHDAHQSFKFRVKWDGRYVAGVSKVSALVRSTDVIEYREGDESTPLKAPGRTKYEPITLERGVTQDTAFEDWANLVSRYGRGDVPLQEFRKDVTLELFNEVGQLVLAYTIYGCWVSEYQALPDLDTNANAVVLQHLKLENDGWERDTSACEQTP